MFAVEILQKVVIASVITYQGAQILGQELCKMADLEEILGADHHSQSHW